MKLRYFDRKYYAGAAADAVITGKVFSLEDFIGCAEMEPRWELEVVCDYIDKIGKLYEQFPVDDKDPRCPFHKKDGEEDIGWQDYWKD